MQTWWLFYSHVFSTEKLEVELRHGVKAGRTEGVENRTSEGERETQNTSGGRECLGSKEK